MAVPITLESVRAAPKVLLHDHLDGGLRPRTVIELADAVGHALPSRDPDALHAYFVRGAETRDIIQYLDTFQHTVAVMQDEASLVRVARECVEDLAADGVVYAEVRFAPELHVANGLALTAVVEAVLSGFREGEQAVRAADGDISVNAILCAMRTERHSMELVHGAERIGHGVRLQRDVTARPDGSLVLGELAQWVLDRQIPLEMAPTCHVQIGAVADIAAHPFVPFLRHGFKVTMNTDNRLMSNVSASSETFTVAQTFGLGWDELEQIAVNGAEAAFAPLAERRALIDDVIRPAYRGNRQP